MSAQPIPPAALRKALAMFLGQMEEARRRAEVGELLDPKQEPLALWAARVCNSILDIPAVAKAVDRGVHRLSDEEVARVSAVVAGFMRQNEARLKDEAGHLLHKLELRGLRSEMERAVAQSSMPQDVVDAQHVIRRSR